MIEFWFDFASPYSYLSAMRIEGLAQNVAWRPFLLGPIFKAQGWIDSPFNLQPVKGAYMWRDMARLCAKFGLAWRQPSVFPRHSVLAAKVAMIALKEPWGAEFCKSVMMRNFAEDRDIGDPAVLADLLGSRQDVLSMAQTAPLRQQTEEAQARGIFGAPTFFAGDEMFWGNDRLEDAILAAAGGA